MMLYMPLQCLNPVRLRVSRSTADLGMGRSGKRDPMIRLAYPLGWRIGSRPTFPKLVRLMP